MKPVSMESVSMKRLLRGIAAVALLGFATVAGAAKPAPALPGDSIYQLPLPLTDYFDYPLPGRALYATLSARL